MSEPLVSVKMITYNHAQYIRKAIEGVLQQKVDFPIELLIGEDCSTDGTREIVFDYQRKYPDIIKVITSEKNVGAKQNSLRTTKACKGKYIAFCEGDDFWQNENKLALQINAIGGKEKHKFVFTDYDVYHPITNHTIHNFVKYRNWKLTKNITPEDIIMDNIGNMILTCTVMICRELYMKIIEADPFLHQNEEFLMGDTQLWADAVNVTQPLFIEESCTTHIISEESVTRSKENWKMTRFIANGFKLKYHLAKKYRLENELIDSLHNKMLHYQMLLSFQTNDSSLASQTKMKKNKLTFKEIYWYLAAKNKCINMLIKRIKRIKRKKECGMWQ